MENITMEIQVINNPSSQQLAQLQISEWPIWTKEISEFPWTYSEPETCYFLAGEVTVTPQGGDPVTMGQGDLVTFPAGLICTWTITAPVRKHYQFG
jgi:uncharacterized protein